MVTQTNATPWSPASIPAHVLTDVEIMAEGLSFPEGPVAMADGSVLVTEIDNAKFTRVTADGKVELIAQCEGGPNGAAIGPDGAAYLCNNGGRFASGNWKGGWIERVDLDSGKVDRLYTECDGRRLSGPNDIVFDANGDFWFTDTGKFKGREREVGSVFWATIDGSRIVEVAHPAETPNGVGLSPDDRTLYYAETVTGRLRRRTIVGPAELEPLQGHGMESLVVGMPGQQPFDSLAVDAEGNVCIATFLTGCITSISADGSSVVQYTFPPGLEDPMPTNICFGGPDLRTAYITMAHTGRLLRCPWPTAGLKLHYNA
jgi:gluconolactonase